MAFPAFFDTCVLYGSYLRDTVLRLAESGMYRPLWSDDVLLELERALVERAGIAERQAQYIIGEIRQAFVDAPVDGYAGLINSMTCDPKDRHVLAAAVRANAEVLVTFNLRDFPRSSTDPYDIRVVHPDEFLLDQLDLHESRTMAALMTQAASLRRPTTSVVQLLEALSRAGVTEFAEAARARVPDQVMDELPDER